MAQIYKAESNTGSYGYMPELSTTIKNLAISANGTEVFDLGEDWRLKDNLVISLVNCADSTGSAVTCDFADTASLLNSTAVRPTGTMAGVNPNNTVRISIATALTQVVFSVKNTARYIRIRIANGTGSAQPATAYIDVRGYSLTP